MNITGVDLFRVGRWNGLTFSRADLDAMVDSFKALRLAGRVPLKFGHNDEQPLTDGQPALGWIERVYRDGDVLRGDFADVPRIVHEAIKSGAYKFVSVELLRDVIAGGQEYAWVVSAVALLGADIPAVRNLGELRQLTMTRRAAFPSGTPMTFTLGGKDSMTDEMKKLKDENARLQRELVGQAIDSAIEKRQCFAAERVTFNRRFGNNATLADWNDWLRNAQKPPADIFSHKSGDRGSDGRDEDHAAEDEAPDAQVVRLTELEIEKSGGKLTYPEAVRKVLKANSELADDYRLQPGVKV